MTAHGPAGPAQNGDLKTTPTAFMITASVGAAAGLYDTVVGGQSVAHYGRYGGYVSCPRRGAPKPQPRGDNQAASRHRRVPTESAKSITFTSQDRCRYGFTRSLYRLWPHLIFTSPASVRSHQSPNQADLGTPSTCSTHAAASRNSCLVSRSACPPAPLPAPPYSARPSAP